MDVFFLLLSARAVESFLSAPPGAGAEEPVSSRSALLATLRRFSAWLAEQGHAATDPLAGLARPKPIGVKLRRKPFLA